MNSDQLYKAANFKKTTLLIAPVVGAILASILAAASIYLDSRIAWERPPLPPFSGDADTARTLLSVIASSVTTLLALIFTITVVAIQLASSQYSPRTLSTLLQDRPSHFTIGVFIGTFTYTLIILLGLRKAEGSEDYLITGFSMTMAFGLAVISLGTFAVHSNHIIQAVRVTSLINRIGRETTQAVESLYPEPYIAGREGSFSTPTEEVSQYIRATKAGVVDHFDIDALCKEASKHNVLIELAPPIGAFIPNNTVLLKIYGAQLPSNIIRHIRLMDERSMEQNLLFGLRQLTDMAVRALSTGINDPATAVQVIDQLHDILYRLSSRQINHICRKDQNNTPRFIARLCDWNDILRVSLAEIRYYGSGSLQVVRRLRTLLKDLIEVAPDARKPGLEKELLLLDKSAKQSFKDESILQLAMEADIRGTGF